MVLAASLMHDGGMTNAGDDANEFESRQVPKLVQPRGAFPHVRVANGFAFVSGTSSRLPDGGFAGAEVDEMGTVTLDMAAQASAVLQNIETILGTIGLDRSDLVDVGVFLVNMNDFGPYNRVWADFFSPENLDGGLAPARTTVAVHQLPHPHLLVEMKATAVLRTNPAY